MTLVLAIGNADYMTFLSDRRLSSLGRPLDDEAGKVAILTCGNARLGVAFSGLARAGKFNTFSWLVSTLSGIGKNEFFGGGIVRALRVRLDDKFKSQEMSFVPPVARRLSVLFAGYIYPATNTPHLACALVSNFQDPRTWQSDHAARPTFSIGFWEQKPAEARPFSLNTLGDWPPTARAELRALRALVEGDKPPEAVIGKGIEIFREIASRPPQSGTVGGQISSVVIWPDHTKNVEAGYHSSRNATTVYFPAEIFCHPNFPGLAHHGIHVTMGDGQKPSGVMATAQVRKNAPCPCGSGKRYRLCHGRLRPRMK